MAWVEVNVAVESVNVHRHDWDCGGDDDPMPRIRVTLHLDGFPSEQTIELVFDNLEKLRLLSGALMEVSADPFEHGRDWRVGEGVDAWKACYR